MGNSPLISYTLISPNKNSPRNHKIDTITIHCVVGQLTAEGICACFTSPSVQASCNYGIGTDGKIALCVDEGDRSWCSSSSSNDNRAVTIECASDTTHPYAINDAVYKSLVKLCADICKRNGIKELKWKADKSLIGQVDKQNMTVHRWFANKACPGDYIYNRLGQIAKEVNALLGTKDEPVKETAKAGIQATDLKGLSEEDVIKKVGPVFTADMKKSGILASVSLAQFILESGYAKTDLAQNANNCFGMKIMLSGNSWPGSTWDGKSMYSKMTGEYKNGVYVTVPAHFRKYPCIEDSIADHSAYLLGAKNGSKKRYEGLAGCKSYKKAIGIIKNGGYATDPNYVSKICSLIERHKLTKYDKVGQSNTKSSQPEKTAEEKWYRVRLEWENQNSQLGAFHDLELAKKTANENAGYKVFDSYGKLIYAGIKKKETSNNTPFKVNVSIDNLNIRTGPGKSYSRVEFIKPGIYTITEVQTGIGSKSGWGKLKSEAGWISLDFATRTV